MTTLDSAKNKFKNAQSQVVVEEKNVERAKSDLEKTQIKAPFSGKISKKLLHKHAEVSPNTGIVQIQSSENHQVSVLIPESMIQFVQYNQAVNIILSTAKKITLEGYVSEIAAKTEAGNAFEVTAIVKGGEATIRPGMTAEVLFEFYTSAQQTAFPVPISALSTKDTAEHEHKKDDKPAIPLYVIDEATSTAKLTWVETIGASGNELYVISGLNEGDKVIVAGVAFLHDGMKVIPWKP